MLADPDVAIFPLLQLAWIMVFESGTELFPGQKKPWRRVLPSAIVCSVYWAAQFALTWKYSTGYRLPAFAYWFAQPWVVLRYLADFLAPVHLTPESDFKGFSSFVSPLALVGFAGVAALIVLAIRLARSEPWRIAAFGLWWFLVALLPSVLVPHRVAEADYRMYLPLMGLALAVAAAGWEFYRRALRATRSTVQVQAIAYVAAAAVLGICCWTTFQRNLIWQSQSAFWNDVLEKNPDDVKAHLVVGSALISDGQPDRGFADLDRAASLASNDAADEISLGVAFDQTSRDSEAPRHFQLALKKDPNYSSAWSAWSRWLITRRRLDEALQAATTALRISPWNLEAEHTLLDYYTAKSDWPELNKHAQAVLRLDPADADASRAMNVAQAGFAILKKTEARAKSQPSADKYLALSVEYFKNHRYEESVKACQEALDIKPGLAEAWNNMAAAYHAQGKNDEAIVALKEAVRLRPDLSVAEGNLNFLLRQQSKKSQP